MTGDVVNLRRERKRRARAAEAATAEANRLRHGLAKVEREAIKAQRDRTERRLDQHALTTADGESATGAEPRER